MTKRVVIQLRVTEEEKAQIEAKAAGLGVDVSTLIRQLVLGDRPAAEPQRPASPAPVLPPGEMCFNCARSKRVGQPVPEKCDGCGR